MFIKNLELPALKIHFTHMSAQSTDGVSSNPIAILRHAVQTAAFNIGKTTVSIKEAFSEDTYVSSGSVFPVVSLPSPLSILLSLSLPPSLPHSLFSLLGCLTFADNTYRSFVWPTDGLVAILTDHYYAGIIKDLGSLVGHSLLIGDPLALTHHVTTAFRVLVKGLTRGPCKYVWAVFIVFFFRREEKCLWNSGMTNRDWL